MDLTEVLAAQGVQVTLLTREGSDLPQNWTADRDGDVGRVPLEPFSRPFELLSRKELNRVAEVLGEADVVHLHGLWRPRNSQIAGLARHLGRPYVLSPHGMLNAWSFGQGRLKKTTYYHLFERKNLAAASCALFSSERERYLASRWIPHNRTKVIPLAVDLAPYLDLPEGQSFAESYPQISEGPPIVLMLGRIHPGKRPELLIQAASHLNSLEVSFQIVFAGTGDPDYVERLRQQAAESPAARHIHFIGSIEGEEKLALYRQAQVFALPSERENFGLVLFESLLCETPVLTTDGPDTWREIAESEGGKILEATPEAFAESIAELLSDKDQRSSMGRAGREWTLSWLNPESIARSYDQLYRQVARQ